MAKYYSSTFGKISGKHGNAVAVIRKDGSTYLRLHVPAGNPRTDKQQAHRAKFALTSRSLVPFNPIFKETIGITNGISTARSHAFKNAIVGEYPNLAIDYEKVMFSFGVLEGLHDASVSITDGVMNVSWNYRKMYNCNKNDNVSFVVFNKDTNQTIHIKDAAVRSDRGANIEIDTSWANDDLYLWGYVSKGDKISNSVYVAQRSVELITHAGDTLKDGVDDVAVKINRCGYTEKDKSIVPFVQSLISGIIVSLVVMLYNLLGPLNKLVTTFSSKSVSQTLAHDSLSLRRFVKETFLNELFKLKIRSPQSIMFKVLHNKYQNRYPLSPIGIMRC